MTPKAIRKTGKTVRKATEMAYASPQVVALRMNRMGQGMIDPRAQDLAEMNRMWTEKVIGFQESAIAMGLASLSAGASLARSFSRAASNPLEGGLLSPKLASQWQSATMDVLNAGIKPIHRRAVGNAKRLSKKAR